jgi:hypothetical protein
MNAKSTIANEPNARERELFTMNRCRLNLAATLGKSSTERSAQSFRVSIEAILNVASQSGDEHSLGDFEMG